MCVEKSGGVTIPEGFELKEVEGKLVKVAVIPMDKEQARKAYPYRPRSKYSESHFGGNNLVDDVALILNGLAKRCRMCRAITKKEYLTDGVCPDCDGRSEKNGTDPHG